MLYRRFRVKTDDPITLEKAERVIKEKNLSREDLLLLLSAIELNDNLKSPEAHVPEFDNATSDQLIDELIRRGATKANAGPYCEYQLKRKYSRRDRAEIECSLLMLPRDCTLECGMRVTPHDREEPRA